MKLKDKFRFIRQNMKKNKSRVFMTVLATAMGCAFLTVLASVGFGLQKSIVDTMIGDQLVTEISIWGKESTDGHRRTFTNEDLTYLRSVKYVKAVTYTEYVRQALPVKVDESRHEGNGAKIVDFQAEMKANFGLSAGRFPEADDEVLIGYHYRDNFTAERRDPSAEVPAAKEWIGKTIEMEVSQYLGNEEIKTTVLAKIVGVAQQPTREWARDSSLYIGEGILQQIEQFTKTMFGEINVPANGDGEQNAAAKSLDGQREYNEIKVYADKASNVKRIGEEIRENGYLNHSIANQLEQINLLFLIMKIGLFFVGTIAVLIASIGIYNTMTMAVTERSQDIGIMKAIGAHPSAIKRIFLLESSYIGILGAAIGTIVAYIISFAVNIVLPVIIEGFMNERVPNDFMFSYIPPYLAVISIILSLGVAMLSGSGPARKATRVDVLRALRRDI